ncbi:MAG: methyltransferase domain-containing protein [Chloroflexi bacterium]|nr:methyltransferase domain-containing protein [Chloroflexota bacterium]
MQSHDDIIRDAFTRQADYISTSPAFIAQERIDLVMGLAKAGGDATTPLDQARVMDVACGAGIVAVALAKHVGKVTGVDLTPAVLEKAEVLAVESGVTNTQFVLGDAAALPSGDASLDLVTCTSAFHHFDQPAQIVTEIARVLKPGGAFCALDITTPEVPAARERHQEMERLRDPSHTTNLTPSAWRRLAHNAGFRVTLMGVVPSHRDLEEWLTICPEEDKDRVRALFQRDIEEGRSGLNVRREGGPILFTHPMLLLRAEKP